MKRWYALVRYTGGRSVAYTFDEMCELHSLIEDGPDWSGLISITVLNNFNTMKGSIDE